MAPRSVQIHYRRLPDREVVFEQEVVEANPTFVVTLLEAAVLERPVVVRDAVVLEPGAPVVWFTYPGEWHDIGRFHLADGTLTGFYANILTPVSMDEGRWETTDLCLDVWMGIDGSVEILDEAELAVALTRGWIDVETARRARREARALAAAARERRWPPSHVLEWDLQRARAATDARSRITPPR